jgi:hypothetical protein
MARKPVTSLTDDSEIESPAPAKIERQAARFVTVACKVPCGMRLQLQYPQTVRVPRGLGGVNDYVETTVNQFGGPAYNVFGPAVPAMGGVPDGYQMPHKIEGDYALTRGVVPADFWEQWLAQNEKAPYVENHMIFAYRDDASAKADAREHEKLMSGLEPLDRHVDSKGRMVDRRIPKPLSGSLARISPDAERMNSRSGAEADV